MATSYQTNRPFAFQIFHFGVFLPCLSVSLVFDRVGLVKYIPEICGTVRRSLVFSAEASTGPKSSWLFGNEVAVEFYTHDNYHQLSTLTSKSWPMSTKQKVELMNIATQYLFIYFFGGRTCTAA